MRDGACKKAGAFAAAALAMCLGLNQTQAQDYYAQDAPAAPGAYRTISAAEYDTLNQRVRALEASWDANAEADEACKEIDIQTKPDHKFRGRMFLDHLVVEDTQNIDYFNFTGFDTIRLGVTGNIYENLKYSVEFEFEGEETDYKDIYAEFSELPWVSTFKLGYYKMPMGLEELTSSRHNTFMEQSAATSAFVPSRKFGITIGGDVRDNEDLSLWAAVYRDLSNDDPSNFGGFFSDHNDTSVALRGVWLPYYDEPSDGRYLMHVGASWFHSKHFNTSGLNNDAVNPTGTFGGSLELDSYTSVINTSLTQGAEYHTMGTELAWVNGPFSIQNEFFWVNANDGSNPWGTYVTASYFLTGENRGYSRSSKTFDRVKPFEPFFAVRTANGVCRGWGAWQLAARYSYLDATDVANGTTGTQQNIALGVNWYLNPYSRVMFNYIHGRADVDPGQNVGASVGRQQVRAAGAAVDSTVDFFGARFQMDW